MSLVESCLVVAVASTVMAIATPSFIRAREVYVLRSAARDVAARMHTARIGAVTRNQDCRLRVTSPVSYIVECESEIWEPVENVVMPPGIRIAANARPEFHRYGNVSPAATITLMNAAGAQSRVIVNLNGRVRIQ